MMLYRISRYLLLFIVFIFTSSALSGTAYAEPDRSDTEPALVGWVEITCSIPKNFHNDISLVISEDASGEIYSVICREVNGYIGRTELPAGSYTIFQVLAGNDFPASCDKSAFEITDHMRAAVGIHITVEDTTGATLIDEASAAETFSDADPTQNNAPNVVSPSDSNDLPGELAKQATSHIIIFFLIISVAIIIIIALIIRKCRSAYSSHHNHNFH